ARGEGGKPTLWIRSLDSPNAQSLRGTDDALSPFWSPNGRFVGFFVQDKLKTIDVASGAIQVLADVSGSSRLGAWGKDDVIIFYNIVAGVNELTRISASGGKPSTAVKLDLSRKEIALRPGNFLPDGRHFLFSAQSSTPSKSSIKVGSLDSQETTVLAELVGTASYADGYLIFARAFTLMAQPFDVNRLKLTGEPVVIANDVQGFHSVSEKGTIAYTTVGEGLQFTEFDRSGRQIDVIGPRGRYLNVMLSPDGKRMAFNRTDDGEHQDIWLMDLDRKVPTRFTSDPERAFGQVWSPDGKSIVFISNRDKGDYHLYRKLTDGSGKEEPLLMDAVRKVPSSWSLDG